MLSSPAPQYGGVYEKKKLTSKSVNFKISNGKLGGLPIKTTVDRIPASLRVKTATDENEGRYFSSPVFKLLATIGSNSPSGTKRKCYPSHVGSSVT